MNYDKDILELKETNDNNKIEKAKAEERLNQSNNERIELLQDLSELKVKPNDLVGELEKLEGELQEGIAEAKSELA